MSAASLELGLKTPGDGWISESGEGSPTFLDHEKVEEISIRAGFDDGTDLSEEDGYFLALAFFHAQAEGDGRQYCASIQAHLGLDQIRLLHEFLGFLLANPRKFEEPI